jgi:cellulose synthase/poly-beta-1,6-N-acetylglucosamine synthase-like glycosyltransferase
MVFILHSLQHCYRKDIKSLKASTKRKEGEMQIFIYLIGLLYLCVVISLCFYGFHNLLIAILYLQRGMPIKPGKTNRPPMKEWPKVTLQLPIFNEKYTIERLLSSITQLEYPADRLQIQVLDDSTDDTAELTRQLVEGYKARGVNIDWIHREDRTGYKAGALHEGLASATGEFIGIFDADFVPRRDWLKKTISLFTDPKVGCLQTRWGHTNRKYNSLTRAEALAVDGHFIVEQTVRSENDFFLNFNGTAGLWRRACIEDAGGWQWDTLTEDLDLSYRAQMRGWKIGYNPNVVVPAELPSEVEAFKKQQFRWAKGSFQVVRKILPRVFKQSDRPLHVRLMAFLHLTGYFVHPLMLSMLILTLPVGLLIPQVFKIFPVLSVTAGIGAPLLYLVAIAPHSPPLLEKLKLLPILTLTGFGLSLNTTIAVLEGLTGTGSAVFVRTPKLNLSNSHKQSGKIDHTYISPINPIVWMEIALGLYALLTIVLLLPTLGWGIVPWMLIYMFGYFYIAGLNLIQHTNQKSATAFA